jgi:hypothetical protein
MMRVMRVEENGEHVSLEQPETILKEELKKSDAVVPDTTPPLPPTNPLSTSNVPAQHEGVPHGLPSGPWNQKKLQPIEGDAAHRADWARKTQAAKGDHDVRRLEEKVAQLEAHPEISGTIAGTGIGDIEDRLHDGIGTAHTLIRSLDIDSERLAEKEFGSAPAPVSLERTQQILDAEFTKLEELTRAQEEQKLRSGSPLKLAERKLFVLAKVADARPKDGEAWFGLRFRAAPGAEPTTILLHARLLSDQFRDQKSAIEELGINLVHGAYFHLLEGDKVAPSGPEALIQALFDQVDRSQVALDYVRLGEPAGKGVDQDALLSRLVHENQVPVEFRRDPPAPRSLPPVEFEHPPVGRDKRALEKARKLNDSGKAIGVVAEIGGSQPVAELFRRAPHSNRTLLRRISNYGMEASTHFYKSVCDRSVSEKRLGDMLTAEFTDLAAKVGDEDKAKHALFAYANTVATKTGGQGQGWLGLEFQTRPNGPRNRIMLHVRMRSQSVPDQEQALKMLGINLIHASQFELEPPISAAGFVNKLMEGVPPGSIEIDHIGCSGKTLDGKDPDRHLEKQLPQVELDAALLEAELARAVIYTHDGEPPPSEYFYERALLIRPERKELGKERFESDPLFAQAKPERRGTMVHLHLTDYRTEHDHLDAASLKAHLEVLKRAGRDVIVTRDGSPRDLFGALADGKNKLNALVLSSTELRRLLNPATYSGTPGGIEAFIKTISSPGYRIYLDPKAMAYTPDTPAGKRAREDLLKAGTLVPLESS